MIYLTILIAFCLGLTIGYIISNIGDKTLQIRVHLKTKLYDLIGHNLALEKGYDCLKSVRNKKQKTSKEMRTLKGKELDCWVKSQHLQQIAKIVFASGLLRELGEKEYVDEQWEKYGIKLSRDKNYLIYKKLK
jgi:hypothetical protein